MAGDDVPRVVTGHPAYRLPKSPWAAVVSSLRVEALVVIVTTAGQGGQADQHQDKPEPHQGEGTRQAPVEAKVRELEHQGPGGDDQADQAEGDGAPGRPLGPRQRARCLRRGLVVVAGCLVDGVGAAPGRVVVIGAHRQLPSTRICPKPTWASMVRSTGPSPTTMSFVTLTPPWSALGPSREMAPKPTPASIWTVRSSGTRMLSRPNPTLAWMVSPDKSSGSTPRRSRVPVPAPTR